jgi:hypothetical protein
MVNQPGLFSPKLWAMYSHVSTQSLQKLQYSLKFTFWSFGNGVSPYHNCCIDGGTSMEYFGFNLIMGQLCIPWMMDEYAAKVE